MICEVIPKMEEFFQQYGKAILDGSGEQVGSYAAMLLNASSKAKQNTVAAVKVETTKSCIRKVGLLLTSPLHNSSMFRPAALCYGRALYFSYNSVCLLVIGISRPLINTYLTWVSISSGSPLVTIRFAIFPWSMEPMRSATPNISAG